MILPNKLFQETEFNNCYCSINLGRFYFCQGEKEKALVYYQENLKAFLAPEKFWESMKHDFQYLTQYGITEDQYAALLNEIKNEA